MNNMLYKYARRLDVYKTMPHLCLYLMAASILSVGIVKGNELAYAEEGLFDEFAVYDERSDKGGKSDCWVVAIAVHQGIYGFHAFPYDEFTDWRESLTSLGLLADHIATSIGVSDVFIDSQLQWKPEAHTEYERNMASPFDAIVALMSSLSGVECGIYLSVPARYMPSRDPEVAVYFVREAVPLVIKPLAPGEHRAFINLHELFRKAGVIGDNVVSLERMMGEDLIDGISVAFEALVGGVPLDRDRSKFVANGSMLLLCFEQPVVLLLR